jgi:hypothetical protein
VARGNKRLIGAEMSAQTVTDMQRLQQQQQNLSRDLQQHLRADSTVQTAAEALSNAAAAAAPRMPAPRAPTDLHISLTQYLQSPRKSIVRKKLSSPAPALPTPPPRRSLNVHRRSSGSKSSGSFMRFNMQKYMDFDSSIGRSARGTGAAFGDDELQSSDSCVPALKRNDSEVRAVQQCIDAAAVMQLKGGIAAKGAQFSVRSALLQLHCQRAV